MYLGGRYQSGRGVSVPSIKQQRRADRIRYAGRGIRQAGRNYNKSGGGGIQPKRQGQGSPQKNLGAKSAKPFRLPKCFGFQKIFRKNFGEMKRGDVSKGRIFGGSGKNLSGVRLFECIYW